jgi:hypothetical protein
VVLIALFAVRRMMLNKARLQALPADTLRVTSEILLFNGDTILIRELDSVYAPVDTARKLHVIFEEDAQWGRTLPVNDSLSTWAGKHSNLIITGLLE